MITINLYDYKRVIRDVGIQKKVILVTAASTAVFIICLLVWGFQLIRIGVVESELAEVETKVATATPDYKAVQHLKKEQTQYTKIITGINKLRSDQARTTEFLEDMGQAVPEGIWLTSVKQMDETEVRSKKVPFLFISYDDKKRRPAKKDGQEEEAKQFDKLEGVGMGGKQIVHFLEQLRAIPYIDAVVLNTSKRDWLEDEPVQKFEIYCHFITIKPAA